MDMKTSLQTLFGKYLDENADQNQFVEDLINFVNITIDIRLGRNPKANKEDKGQIKVKDKPETDSEGPFIPKKRKRPNKGKSKRQEKAKENADPQMENSEDVTENNMSKNGQEPQILILSDNESEYSSPMETETPSTEEVPNAHTPRSQTETARKQNSATIRKLSTYTKITHPIENKEPKPGPSARNEDDNEDEIEYEQQTTTKAKKVKIPPLVINPKFNKGLTWSKLQRIFQTNNINIYDSHINRAGEFKITPQTSTDHRSLTKILEEQNIKYHTFVLPEDKVLKVVIRGVDPDGDCQDYLTELQLLGYPVISVHRITSNRTGRRTNTPLIIVQLEKSDSGKQIFNITHFMHLRVNVETLRRRPGPGQCHRCQRFGHSAMCCRLTPRCVSCGSEHESFRCPQDKEKTAPKCANCNKDHPANFRGCEKFPKLNTKSRNEALPKPRVLRQQKVRDGTSFADAVKKDNNKEDEIIGHQLTTLLNLLMKVSPEKLKLMCNLLNLSK